MWLRPSAGRFKCNIRDAEVGIGMCIRDAEGNFVLAKTEWFLPISSVEEGETTSLLIALRWVKDLEIENVDFELDSKKVVD
jgi:ribonuclease HI